MSRWIEHIKATMAKHPDIKKKQGLKGILKLASKTYKKTAKVGHGVVKRAHKKRTHRRHKTAKRHRSKSSKRKSSKRKSSKRKHRKH